MSVELWRPVVGFEGAYEVSNRGRVRSLARSVRCSGPEKGTYLSRKPGRVLSPGRVKSGHVSVVLGRKGGSRLVHALVLEAFRGPRPSGSDVRHLNGVPDDNRLENLAYGSRSENGRDKKWHGGAATYKLNPAQVGSIKRALAGGARGVDLAQTFAVSQSTISSIKWERTHADVDCVY